jgi:dTDP-glucose 4,6-dehydratase
MNILVTGGLGFIGSNFILYLIQNYPEIKIINIDAEVLGSNKKNLSHLKNKNYKYFKGNITDKKLLKKLIPRVDSVINFAAESHVDRSISNSEPFLKSNILGVYSILDTIRKNSKKTKFLQISTDEVFGSKSSGSAQEGDTFHPSNPYSASKASAELIIESYVKTYDLDIMITRCTNNFGPQQFPEKLIPKTLIRSINNLKIPIYGTGKNIRDWLYVEDHCDAISKVLLNGKSGESYNISGNNLFSNIQLVKKILKNLDKNDELIDYVIDRPGHDLRYSLDSSKIRHKLGWKPKQKFDKSLSETVNWYLENKAWWKNLATKQMLSPTPWKKYRK